jgi:transcriptional regulator with XRE-family HTH domain
VEEVAEVEEPLTFGGALAGVRESVGESLAAFARRLRVSRQHLCDIEQGRKVVSAERAARFARALKQPEALFVKLTLDDALRAVKLQYAVELHAIGAKAAGARGVPAPSRHDAQRPRTTSRV